MDKSKRKSLIISYLKNSINLRDFSNEVDFDLQAMSDPILGAIRSDLSDKADASVVKGEILAFDKQQEEESVSLGSDYIEAEKRRLTLQVCGYTSLLADPEVRGIMEKWGTTNEIALFQTSAEEYKNTSFTHLLKFLERHPDYNSEIQEILAEIESENGLSEELQEFSDTVNSKEEEKRNQDAKREELVTFMDETLKAFNALLQLDDIDNDTFETIKNASMQSYKIWVDKYSKLTADLANNPSVFVTNFYPHPTGEEERVELAPYLQEKLNQIENAIKQLEGKYGNFTQDMEGKEQGRTQEESIKDQVGEELKTKTLEPQQKAKKPPEIWVPRLQENYYNVDNIPEGAHEKEIVVQLIQLLDRESQRTNGEELTPPSKEKE